jgi:hypothetical protein
MRWRSWLSHYATSRKVPGSSPNEVDFFFQFTYSFQPHYGSGADSATNTNEYQEYSWNILGVKGRPARKADNLIAICEPII